MKYQTEGNTIVLVLEKGEDIIGSVTKSHNNIMVNSVQ